MPKRKKMLPAGDKADDLSRLPLAADLVSLPNISSGREWLAAIRAADPQIRPESAAYSADKALKCLAVGDIDAALSHAMWAAWRTAHATGQWGHWQMQSALMPLASREIGRRDALADNKAQRDAEFNRRLDDAIERLTALLNSDSRMNWTAKIRRPRGKPGLASGLSASTCPPI